MILKRLRIVTIVQRRDAMMRRSYKHFFPWPIWMAASLTYITSIHIPEMGWVFISLKWGDNFDGKTANVAVISVYNNTSWQFLKNWYVGDNSLSEKFKRRVLSNLVIPWLHTMITYIHWYIQWLLNAIKTIDFVDITSINFDKSYELLVIWEIV